MSAEHVDAMGAVLAEHYPEMNYDGEIDGCGCDRQIGAFVGMTDREDYALHLATVLAQSPAMRELLAEAWDECAASVHVALEEGMVGRLNEPGNFLRGARRMRLAAKHAYEANPYRAEDES